MGFVEFIVVVFIVCGLAYLGTLALRLIPDVPKIAIQIVWFVAILIIVVLLARALGLGGHDVQIPKLF